ncbi:protein zwilch [Episyrphus balteatus]|uniref:protein zwilch n=1 Tax=Episyrphus balteatus TaxID=286459 RepID=UPI0024862014|nr:protein zwilch [Episyrphus balteatus]
MSSNLANLYAFMRRSFGDCGLMYSIPPSYLQKLTGETKKVIFVYEEDKNKMKYISNFVSPSKLNIKQQENDLNLTGSPLKDDCVVDAIDMSIDLKYSADTPWSAEEECYKGVRLDFARSILTDFNFQKESINSRGSVWILCSGADDDKTVLLEMEFEPKSNIRGMVVFKGVIPTANVTSQDIFQHYTQLTNNNSKINTQIENLFNIKSNINLKVSWSTASLTPSLNNLKNSDVVLYQTFSVTECSSLTEDFLNQLRILAYIKEDIVAFKESKKDNSDPVYRCGRGIEMDLLKEKVFSIMTELSGLFDMDSTCFEIEAVVQRAKERTLTDLTDKLWEVLKCCSSYRELKQALNYVFQCAAKCNIVNLPTNNNRLAEIINEVSQQRLAIPCLTGSEPLELLLEIGLEKLFKDYEFIFTECKMCSSNDLKATYSPKAEDADSGEIPMNIRKSIRSAIRPDATPSSHRKTFLHSNSNGSKKNRESDVVGFQNSVFNQVDVELKLARLLQIHLALEHLLLIQINLNLENVHVYVCEQLLKKKPRIYKTIDDSLVDKIEIPLASESVSQHLEGKDPSCRKITLQSKNAFREVQSTFFYSMENVFPANAAECYQTDDKEMIKENVYFCWNYTKIKSRRC